MQGVNWGLQRLDGEFGHKALRQFEQEHSLPPLAPFCFLSPLCAVVAQQGKPAVLALECAAQLADQCPRAAPVLCKRLCQPALQVLGGAGKAPQLVQAAVRLLRVLELLDARLLAHCLRKAPAQLVLGLARLRTARPGPVHACLEQVQQASLHAASRSVRLLAEAVGHAWQHPAPTPTHKSPHKSPHKVLRGRSPGQSPKPRVEKEALTPSTAAPSSAATPATPATPVTDETQPEITKSWAETTAGPSAPRQLFPDGPDPVVPKHANLDPSRAAELVTWVAEAGACGSSLAVLQALGPWVPVLCPRLDDDGAALSRFFEALLSVMLQAARAEDAALSVAAQQLLAALVDGAKQPVQLRAWRSVLHSLRGAGHWADLERRWALRAVARLALFHQDPAACAGLWTVESGDALFMEEMAYLRVLPRTPVE